MGKGYNNFMSKKPFHPASKENIKRVWMAEQRTQNLKKKEDEMRLQYEKEQDLYNNRVLVAGSDSKDKLSLNFMYEAPPGVKRETKETETEPEYKFEWQRNAPRESFAKNNMDIRDQPFGIQVRNVRCLKCHKWGHVNTDRECPLFNTSAIVPEMTTEQKEKPPPPSNSDQSELIKSMKEEQGLALKRSLYGSYGPDSVKDEVNQKMLAMSNPDVMFLESLSSKEKKRLLKKLQKLTKSTSLKKDKKKSKKKNHKHKSKKSKKSPNSSESSDSDSGVEKRKPRKRTPSPDSRKRKYESRNHHRNGHNGRDNSRSSSPEPKRHRKSSAHDNGDSRRSEKKHRDEEHSSRRHQSSAERKSNKHRPDIEQSDRRRHQSPEPQRRYPSSPPRSRSDRRR